MSEVTDPLTRITELGHSFIHLSREIEDLEKQLANTKKLYNRLSTEVIPEAMRKVGMTAFQLGNRFGISIQPVLVVKLDKEKVEEADMWLDINGHSGMVKNHVEVFVPKDIDPDKLEKLLEGIKATGLDYTHGKSIHYQTLNRWARDMTAEGEVIPEDIFNVYRGTKTVIEGE